MQLPRSQRTSSGRATVALGTAVRPASGIVATFGSTSATGAVHGGRYWDRKADGALVSPQSDRCPDVAGGSSTDGVRPVVWTCGSGQANQRWNVPC